MLTTAEKLNILGEAARYDASCSSSGSGRQGKPGGFGNAHMAGICHTWTDDGRCLSLLKVLYSNACIFDCAYCVNRTSNDVPRATFEPDELAQIVVEFYKRNYIEGLFLSSGIIKNPDYTMEQLIKTVSLLRNKYNYYGYIHVKVVPGTSKKLIEAIGLLADRISVNIELPSKNSLALLAPQKKPKNITLPMQQIKLAKLDNAEARKKYKKAPLFAPAGQSTQIIVGATPDSDLAILRLSEGLYNGYSMKRVYYSAYLPVGKHPALPSPETKVPLLREHRLYQADWLLRFYGFQAAELLNDDKPSLDLELDPKCNWALNNLHLFPVEVNTADYQLLLRIPGIGVQSAWRIIAARKEKRLHLEDLKKLGIVMKRAQYFVTAAGKFGGRLRPESHNLHTALAQPTDYMQLSLFDLPTARSFLNAGNF